MLRLVGGTVVGLALLTILGCGGAAKSLDTASVSGTITLDGTPVQGATVTFSPAGQGGQTASGITDSSGRYKLTTRSPNDGALPGGYSVTVSKMEGSTSGDSAAPMSQEESMKLAQEMMNKARMNPKAQPTATDLLPPKYKSAATSGFKAEVTKGGKNEFDFELTSK